MIPEEKRRVHILFTADRHYAVHIPAVIKSIRSVDPEEEYDIHLINDGLPEEMEKELARFSEKNRCALHFYRVSEDLFQSAPVNKHYSKAMYYRMLATEILPHSLERVLYLDPDILVINSLIPLWETEMEGYGFAAASHNIEAGIVDNINRVRLETSSVYFNTGVLLMDLIKCRDLVKKEDVLSIADKPDFIPLLPDQDVFNALYGDQTKQIPDEIWNYDARKYSQYLRKSMGVMDESWVIRNTAILHFCGKDKPWNLKYRYRFGNLYRHYEHLCEQDGWKI